MDNSLEENVGFKRRFKRALIVFAVVEFIVISGAMIYFVQK